MSRYKNLGIDDKFVDDIVEDILSKVRAKESASDEHDPSIEIAKLKLRMKALETKLDRYIKDYRTTAVEFERQLSEKSSDLEEENESQLLAMQNQLETLRVAMIRLSAEVRRMKEIHPAK